MHVHIFISCIRLLPRDNRLLSWYFNLFLENDLYHSFLTWSKAIECTFSLPIPSLASYTKTSAGYSRFAQQTIQCHFRSWVIISWISLSFADFCFLFYTAIASIKTAAGFRVSAWSNAIFHLSQLLTYNSDWKSYLWKYQTNWLSLIMQLQKPVTAQVFHL